MHALVVMLAEMLPASVAYCLQLLSLSKGSEALEGSYALHYVGNNIVLLRQEHCGACAVLEG